MKFLLAGGGTGGHFFPALSVAEELLKRGHEVLYIGSLRGIESKEEFPSRKELLDVSGFVGRGFKGIVGSYKFLTSSFRVWKLIREFNPDSAIVFGGYSSLPAGIASLLSGLPLFVQEQNSVPGRVNRFLSRFSKECFLGFPFFSYFNKPSIFTGNPIREKIKKSRKLKKKKIKEKLGLNTERETLLILGGSQGALWINEKISELLPQLANLKIQVIHITGKNKKEKELKEKYREHGIRALVLPFYKEIGELYRIADAAVSRAGALAISEMAVFGIPTILIPFPYAADNHQLKNAKYIEGIGGALCRTQEELSGKTLFEDIERILFDKILKDKLKENFLKFARPNAASEIAERLCEERD